MIIIESLPFRSYTLSKNNFPRSGFVQQSHAADALPRAADA
jgi:hypothetical protein